MRRMSSTGRALALRLAPPALLALLLASNASAAPPAPAATGAPLSPHAFRKLVERARPAVVPVVSKPRGTAVLVGVNGDLLAPAKLVRNDRLEVEVEGTKLQARLVKRDEQLGLALLALEASAPVTWPAAHVGSAGSLAKGEALVAVAFDTKGKLVTHAGRYDGRREVKGVDHLRTTVAGPQGSAVFNRRGELVAVHAGKRRATIPIDAVKQRFASADAP